MIARPQISGRAVGSLSILALLLLLAGFGGFASVTVLQAKWLELEARQAQLEALEKRRQIPPEKVTAEAPIAFDPFLSEDNFALAANALQERVVGLVEDVEGKLLSVGLDPQTTGDDEAARRVSVHVAAELTSAALQKLLYRLETETPLSFISRLSATRPVAREQGAAAQQEPQLSVSFSVTGYRRKGSP